MQFDFFDKKIKEAAEHHHPAYDENAWGKMEKLLDKHLPQDKEDKRRIIFFFLLLFLLLGGGAYVLIGKPWRSNKPVSKIEKTAEQNIPASATEKNTTQEQSTVNNPSNVGNENTPEKEVQVNSKDNIPSETKSTISQTPIVARDQKANRKLQEFPISSVKSTINNRQKNSDLQNSQVTASIKNNYNTIVSAPNNNSQQSSASNDMGVKKTATDNSAETKKETSEANDKSDDLNKKAEAVSKNQPEKKGKGKNNKNSFFSFTVSAGPDVSKAGSSSLSKATLSYGAGVSYTLKKFTLRSGFYVAKKVYNANAADYKLNYTLPSYIKLLNVDADCKVYEIPFSLTYNFVTGKNYNWYAGIGLSSYLMKEERYDNWYKNTNSGSIYPRSFQYNNRNKHYFSVLDLSAGYTYRINKTFSLSAEPYIKIPLQGIGEGKVHLNSGGVLFTVGIRPFK